MSTPGKPGGQVRCRVITEADFAGVAALLARGFPGRSEAHWLRGLRRQLDREVPPDVPRHGYLLDSGGRTVGALLLIYTTRIADGAPVLRCNLSSWYVEPEFRANATLLTAVAQKNKAVTFVNLTAARHTWPIIEAQGFRRACDGLFFSVPLLSGGSRGTVEAVGPDPGPIAGLDDEELSLLRDHAALGCLSLVCRTAEGAAPFILAPYRIRAGRIPLPGVQLVYARGLDAYRRCAGMLGRFLLLRGRGFVVLAADGPIAGLAGLYTDRRGRRYVRGPHPPGLYDLTDSEFVLFGP